MSEGCVGEAQGRVEASAEACGDQGYFGGGGVDVQVGESEIGQLGSGVEGEFWEVVVVDRSFVGHGFFFLFSFF